MMQTYRGVVSYWNKLPDDVVLASSASCLKNACLCLLEILALPNIVYVILLDISRLELILLGTCCVLYC